MPHSDSTKHGIQCGFLNRASTRTYAFEYRVKRGFALILTMLFLTVLTIVGLSAGQNSAISERISSNYLYKYDSLAAASNGAAEWINQLINTTSSDCLDVANLNTTDCTYSPQHNLAAHKSGSPNPDLEKISFEMEGFRRTASGAVLATTTLTVEIAHKGHSDPTKVGKVLRWQESN